MGNANSSRPDDLPPSQGGRYAGFGSTPEPEYPTTSSYSSHPSYSTSSHSVPTLDELQRNPLGALSKGWGLFSSAVATAGKEINQSVLQPGMTRAQELAAQAAGRDERGIHTGQGGAGGGGDDEWKRYLDTFASGAKQAAGWAGQRANEGWDQVNHLAKERGVDLDEQFKKLGLAGSGAGAGERGGYGQLERAEDGVITPHGGADADDDFFESWDQPASSKSTSSAGKSATGPRQAQKSTVKDDWNKDDDEWKDF